MILKSLRTVLDIAQQAGATAPQLGIVPGPNGALAIICAWDHAGHTHEVATHYTGQEVETATPEQFAASLAVLAQEAADQAARIVNASLTPMQVQGRIASAARQTPAALAAQELGRIAEASKA